MIVPFNFVLCDFAEHAGKHQIADGNLIWLAAVLGANLDDEIPGNDCIARRFDLFKNISHGLPRNRRPCPLRLSFAAAASGECSGVEIITASTSLGPVALADVESERGVLPKYFWLAATACSRL